MFTFDASLAAFSNGHRLVEHARQLETRLSGIDVSVPKSLMQLCGFNQSRLLLLGHSHTQALGDLIQSANPTVNIQMVCLYILEGGDLSRMSSAPGHLLTSVCQTIGGQGWSNFDMAFTNPLGEEARRCQRALSQYLYRSRLPEHSMVSQARLLNELESLFLARSAEIKSAVAADIEPSMASCLMILAGMSGDSGAYVDYDQDSIDIAALSFIEHDVVSRLGFQLRTQFLDRLLKLITYHFVSIWSRKGIAIACLDDGLCRRVRALCNAFEISESLESNIENTLHFMALAPFTRDQENDYLNWEHALGISLGLHRLHVPRNRPGQGAMTPLEDMPFCAVGPLLMPASSELFGCVWQSLVDGRVPPGVMARYAGPYCVKPYDVSLGDESVVRDLVMNSPYLSLIIPEALYHEQSVMRYERKLYARVLSVFSARVLAGRNAVDCHVGVRKKPLSKMIGWIRKHDARQIGEVFQVSASSDSKDMQRLADLLGISQCDFDAQSLEEFSACASRALLIRELGM